MKAESNNLCSRWPVRARSLIWDWIALVALRFEPTAFRSQAQHPVPLSHSPPHQKLLNNLHLSYFVDAFIQSHTFIKEGERTWDGDRWKKGGGQECNAPVAWSQSPLTHSALLSDYRCSFPPGTCHFPSSAHMTFSSESIWPLPRVNTLFHVSAICVYIGTSLDCKVLFCFLPINHFKCHLVKCIIVVVNNVVFLLALSWVLEW